jgi:tetratricopeptide (TPR) repeat protein
MSDEDSSPVSTKEEQNVGVTITEHDEFYGSVTGIPIVELVLVAKLAVGTVAGGFLGAMGKDLWEKLKIRINRHKSAAMTVHEFHNGLGDTSHRNIVKVRCFVILTDDTKIITCRVDGIGSDETRLRADIHALAPELEKLWEYRLAGAFDQGKKKQDREVDFISLRIDEKLRTPVIELFAQKPNLPLDGMLLGTMLPNTSSETGAQSYRYVGWRLMNLTKEPPRFEEARQEFMIALHLFGYDEPETCHGIAESYFRVGNNHEALDWYLRVVGRERDKLSLLLNHGICLWGAGKMQEAEQLLLRASELYPEHPHSHYNLACIYATMGQLDKALERLELAIGAGWNDTHLLDTDPDLKPVRTLPRFRSIRARIG